MRNLLLIITIFLFSGVYAQDMTVWSFKDTISGGQLDIHLDPKLEAILKGKEKKICQKTVYVPPKKLTPADKCATQNKIMGYKIQIFYTKDRSAAEKVKNDFAKQYPSLTPELIYASPDYRILVGDYFTHQSANQDLRKIQRAYPAAFPVQWRVWCRKAI